jgi:hypothetical protein
MCKIVLSLIFTVFSTTVFAQTIVPLAVGNKWILDVTKYDSTGTIIGSYVDSLMVVGDTLILTETWFIDHTGSLKINRADGLYQWDDPGELPWLVLKYPTYVDDTFSSKSDTAFVISIDTLITVPSGSYSCIRYDYKRKTDLSLKRHFFGAPMVGSVYWEEFSKTSDGSLFRNKMVELKSYSVTNINENILSPIFFSLLQNYPNPFNPTTTIKFQIPELNFVTLKVFDVLGNEIATLVNEEKPMGIYEVEFDGKGLPSGIYFYQLQASNFVETKKMILLK